MIKPVYIIAISSIVAGLGTLPELLKVIDNPHNAKELFI